MSKELDKARERVRRKVSKGEAPDPADLAEARRLEQEEIRKTSLTQINAESFAKGTHPAERYAGERIKE